MYRVTLSVCLFFALFVPQSATSQQEQQPSGPPGANFPRHEEPGPNVPDDMKKAMEKKANEQRQAQLKQDTEKLLKLSTELKEYVDKSNENILSLDVIKKADEIEKLAHSVKTKMRGTN
ncbi:MAG TPA: hypothetical protein VFA85_07620 [Terriglobales bacterium]|nr:hypothetical protein [Terriglobales bacterium]